MSYPFEQKTYNNQNSNQFNNQNNGGYQNKQQGNKNAFFKRKEEEIDMDNYELYKTYVGTGNRDIPNNIKDQIKRLAHELESFGYILRTGGLDGAEQAFEEGTSKLELHLPWRGFNDKESKFTFTPKAALAIAKKFHTAFDTLKPAIQTLLAKNARLVLGKDLKSPAMFMICWSEDGAETIIEKTARTGNVGHAIAIAAYMKIPIFNLGKHDAEKRLKHYLGLSNE